MFIFSLFNVLYCFMCCFIVFLVLLQKGKGNMGLGSMGGGNQMLFGSSGGQDIFQKITWILCALLLIGSFGLSVSKGKYGMSRSRINYTKNMPAANEDVSSDDTQADDQSEEA